MVHRDNKGVGVAHEIKPPKNQPRFSQMIMRQYWLDKTKLSNIILSKSCYGFFLKIIKWNFLLTA